MTLILTYCVRKSMQNNSPVYYFFWKILKGSLSLQFFLHFQILHICIRTWSISQREEKKKPSWSMLDRSLPPLRICSFWGSFSKIMFLFGALSLILTVHSSYAPPSLTCSAIFKHKKNKLRKMYKGRDCCWQMVKITVSGERIGGFKSRSLEKP